MSSPLFLLPPLHHCNSHVSKKLSKLCQSISEGLAEQRYVAVVAKGSAPPVCR